MSTRNLGILVVVTVVLLIAAFLAYRGRAVPEAEPASEFLFAALGDQVNEVALITVTGAENTFGIRQDGEEWRVDSKGGYPAQVEKVKQAILGLSQLKRVESKTSNPELYDRIGLGEPGTGDSTAVLVTLAGKDGGEMASVILGDQVFQGRTQRTYVRTPGDPQSWLVEGRVQVDPDPMSWLDAEIIRLARDRVERVTITQTDGERLEVFRPSEEEVNFSVVGIPEGRTLQYEAIGGTVGGALASLRFEDVRPRDEIELDPAETSVAEFRTFDGLVVTLRAGGEDEEETWVQFDVDIDESALPAAAPADGEGDDPAAADAASQSEAAAAILEEADALAVRLGQWTYKIGATNVENLRKRMDDLLAPLPDPAEADDAAATTPPAAGG